MKFEYQFTETHPMNGTVLLSGSGTNAIEILKTAREDIPGRPIRYGLKLSLTKEAQRKIYLDLRRVWNMKKKANIRRKFQDYLESKEG